MQPLKEASVARQYTRAQPPGAAGSSSRSAGDVQPDQVPVQWCADAMRRCGAPAASAWPAQNHRNQSVPKAGRLECTVSKAMRAAKAAMAARPSHTCGAGDRSDGGTGSSRADFQACCCSRCPACGPQEHGPRPAGWHQARTCMVGDAPSGRQRGTTLSPDTCSTNVSAAAPSSTAGRGVCRGREAGIGAGPEVAGRVDRPAAAARLATHPTLGRGPAPGPHLPAPPTWLWAALAPPGGGPRTCLGDGCGAGRG